MVERTRDMKILPSDDLSHKPDYNENYKKYLKEEVVDTVNTQSKTGLVSPLLRTLLFKIALRNIFY